MGILTLFLIILGTLVIAAGMTLVLDVLASYCFRPLEAAEGFENQARQG